MAAGYIVENEDNQIIGTIYFKYDTDGGGIGGQKFFCTKCKGGTEIEIIGDGAAILTWDCHCPRCGDRFTAKGRLPAIPDKDEPIIDDQPSGRTDIWEEIRKEIRANWLSEVVDGKTKLDYQDWFAQKFPTGDE